MKLILEANISHSVIDGSILPDTEKQFTSSIWWQIISPMLRQPPTTCSTQRKHSGNRTLLQRVLEKPAAVFISEQ
jgi:hypothetical protein